MPHIDWSTLSELRHELANARTVLKGCIKQCEDSDFKNKETILRLMKGMGYHFKNIQDKLNEAINGVENEN